MMHKNRLCMKVLYFSVDKLLIEYFNSLNLKYRIENFTVVKLNFTTLKTLVS